MFLLCQVFYDLGSGLLNRFVQHLKMKPFARIRVPGGDCFVQFDPQTGLGWRDDISFFPANRIFQDLGVKAAPGLNAFLNQEIRAAGVNLNVGGAVNRPTLQMRCNQTLLFIK